VLCDRMYSRISLVSLMGMLEYVLDMSSEANREVEVNRVCFSSSIKCFVFFTLKAKGSGTSCILCVNSFASLYAGALHQFTIGCIGRSGLCIFTRPLMVGADGLRWVYSKTCLKRNAIVPVFFSPFSQVSVLQRVVF